MGDEDIDVELQEFRRKFWQPFVVSLSPSQFNDNS
jgi:hypothetical protein